jgi:Ribonuclease G/E
MQSAFVDIGLDSDAFLYVSDFLEHLEEYDHVAPVEPRVHRPQQPRGGEVYPPTTIDGGVVPPPVHVPEPKAAASPIEPAELIRRGGPLRRGGVLTGAARLRRNRSL